MSKYPEKCHVNGCPCGYFSSKSPAEPSTTEKGDAGFLVPEAENVLSGDSGAGNGILVPTFDYEWESGPRWARHATEEAAALYWFIRGQHAKEVELVAGMNLDLREMVRVARERMGR